MPTETIVLGGEAVRTLCELLRPGLRAIIVGINPSPVSVQAGHYYQGQLGRRLWQRLTQYGILTDLAKGQEDMAAYRQGFGFVDLIRRPTRRAAELTAGEVSAAIPDLLARLKPYAKDDPLILFVFKQAADAVGPALQSEGFRIQRFPAPYLKSEKVEAIMKAIKSELSK